MARRKTPPGGWNHTGNQKRNPEREFVMISLVSGGESLEQIGKRFGLSRERVRQLVARHGVRSQNWNKADPLAICRAADEAHFLAEAAEIANASEETVRRVLVALGKWEEAKKRWGMRQGNKRDWTNEELLECLRAEATLLGETPGQIYLSNRSPSSTTYAKYFGTLTEALRQAGLPLRNHRRNKMKGREDEVARRYRSGESAWEIAKALGVTDGAIYHWLTKMGVPMYGQRRRHSRARNGS